MPVADSRHCTTEGIPMSTHLLVLKPEQTTEYGERL